MGQTFLTLINDFGSKFGLPGFGGVVGNTEATAKQFLALTHEVTEELQRYTWEGQRKRIQWVGVIGEDQGKLTTLFPGYRGLLAETLWNHTSKRPIYGPLSDSVYQSWKASGVSGPIHNFRVAEGKLWIVPALTATDTLSVVYKTVNGVVTDTSGVLKERVSADNDTFLYSDRVFKATLEWKWLKQKGEPWATAKEDAMSVIAEDLAKDDSLPELNLSPGTDGGMRPGIIIPAGSWNV